MSTGGLGWEIHQVPGELTISYFAVRVNDTTGLLRRQVVYVRASVLKFVGLMLLLLLGRHDDSQPIRG